ncbi:MAG: membrane protein insertase YidC [Streptosporangiaceae bacterium]
MSILNPLADLVAWAIIHIHIALGALFGPNTGLAWGLSIAVLVIIIRLLLVPLFVKQVHAQRKMAQHAPQIAELKKKYKNDKQRLNEETMKFYKENGVNPLAGCLPMIPQMIVFFSLFYVLRAIAEWKPGVKPAYGLTVPIEESAQKATIFGVHLGDKLLFAHPSPPVHIAIVIALTVVVSASTTFMTVRQSSKRGLMGNTTMDPDNPMAQSQKYMMYVIPFFSLTGLYWQYGLVLYWVTTNLWTLGQQYFMFRNWEPPVPATAGAAGTTVRTTGSSPRPTSGAARPSAGGSAKAPSGGPRTAASNGRTGGTAPRPRGSGGSGARTQPSPRSQGAAASVGSTGQNGTEKRGLLRLGKPKPEPEPEPEVPSAKVVRQQPTRQAKSKRSGKR